MEISKYCLRALACWLQAIYQLDDRNNHCKILPCPQKFCHLGKRLQYPQFAATIERILSPYATINVSQRTAPAQKICEGHHPCSGGNGACEGSKEANDAVGEGVAVVTVIAIGVVEEAGVVDVTVDIDMD